MRIHTATKIILLLALRALNLAPPRRASAQSGCVDNNCCENCGYLEEMQFYTLPGCTGHGSTCYVTA